MSGILCINITSRTESKVLIPYHETDLCYTPPKINEVLLQVYELWAKKYIGLGKKEHSVQVVFLSLQGEASA